jgi:hypothetical protein
MATSWDEIIWKTKSTHVGLVMTTLAMVEMWLIDNTMSTH